MTQSGGDVAALQARLRDDDSASPSPSDDPQYQQRKRRMIQVAIAWGISGVIGAGALVLLSLGGAERSAHQEEVASRLAPVEHAQDRIYAADEAQGMLPDAREAERWLSQADGAARSMMSAQNTFLAETGPVDVSRVSAFEDSIPSYIEADPEHPERDGYRRSDQQRRLLAEQDRATELDGLSRLLASHVDERLINHPEWSNDFDPTQRWHNAVTTLDDADGEVSLRDYRWQMDTPQLYRPDGQIPVVWRLAYQEGSADADEDTDEADLGPTQLVAVLSAEYNPQSRVIENFALHSAADHEQEGADATEDSDAS